jgi:hypothetical protein
VFVWGGKTVSVAPLLSVAYDVAAAAHLKKQKTKKTTNINNYKILSDMPTRDTYRS